MKIKKYNPQEETVMHFIKSDAEDYLTMVANSGDKGSEEDPYSLIEFAILIKERKWTGGYVFGLGYVGRDEYVISPDSASDSILLYHSPFDLESYMSSVFSFLSRPDGFSYPISVPDKNGSASSSDSTSTGGNGNANKETQLEVHEVFIGNCVFEFSFFIFDGVAVVSAASKYYEKQDFKKHKFLLQIFGSNGKRWELYLGIKKEEKDGSGYVKYTFSDMLIPYVNDGSYEVYLTNEYMGNQSVRII